MATTPRNRKTGLTAERLRELLDYDPATGIFRWRVAPARCVQAGAIAGYVGAKGYRRVMIGGRNYQAHRLAWLYVHGQWPPGELDHEDRSPDRNAVENLRPATQSQNGANQKRASNNTSGYKGVSRLNGKWRAQVKVNGRMRYIGCYDTPEDAHAAYCKIAAEVFGEFFSPG